jgi:DNA-binding GntR family transcriptional regulator
MAADDSRKAPRSDAIADAIRSSIVAGRLVPGDRLPEDRVAEEFGVSRVPVREAIRRLDAEGYVTVTPNAGARVAVLSPQDANDLLQVRTTLEVLAGRLAAEQRGGGRLDDLATLLAEGERAVAERRFDVLPELSSRFHEVMIEASGNAHLVRILSDVRAKLAWIWAVDIEARAPTSWAAHKEIFVAVSAADPDRTAAAIVAHVRDDEVREEGPDRGQSNSLT